MILNAAPGGLPCASRSLNATRHPLPSRVVQTRQDNPMNQTSQTVCHSLFNFAQVEVKETGRRNRKQEKRESQGLLRVVKGLTDMSPKQLQGVSHLLEEDMMDAIAIAARIPRSNQGRKRQEGLVEKLLRNHLDKRELDKLEEAVKLSEGNSIYQDPDLAVLVEGWCEGIAAGDQDVIGEVLAAQASHLAAGGSAGSMDSGSMDSGSAAGVSAGASRIGRNGSDEESWDEESAGSSGDEDVSVEAEAESGRENEDGTRNAEQRSLLNLISRFRDVTQEQQELQRQQQQRQQQQGHSEEWPQGDGSADVPVSSISGRLAEEEDVGELQQVLAMASAMAKRRGSRKRAAAAVKGGKGVSDGSEGDGSSGIGGFSAAEKAQAQKRRKVLRSMKAALKPLAMHVMSSSMR